MTTDDIIAAAEFSISGPSNETKGAVWDFRGVDFSLLRGDAISEMADTISKKIVSTHGTMERQGRSAIIADSAVVAGLLNMAEVYMDARMRDSRVFTDMDEGIAWVEEYYQGRS